MSITDELRTYTKYYSVAGSKKDTMLSSIADRIDAEHERVCRDLTIGAEPMTDERMAEHGWVRMPRDAVGEYIHVGDVMDGYGKTIEVVEMRYGRGGWVLISRDGGGFVDCAAFSHHREPTVEDVLAEFFEEVGDGLHTIEAVDTRAIIEKYAAKLRLAGDAE